jgi:hypothetical protein
MISINCDINDFIEAIKDKDLNDIIYLADVEATAAERCRWRKLLPPEDKQTCGAVYAGKLKDLVSYLRYATRPKGQKYSHLKLFETIEKNLEKKRSAHLI